MVGIYKSQMESWTKQLNIYAHLYRKAGFTPEKLEIVAFLKDWSRMKAKADKDYPQFSVAVVPIKLWSPEETEKFITERIQLIQGFEDIDDYLLPQCTREERWQTDDTWAVKKKANKELKRLSKLSPHNPEGGYIRNYLDWLTEIPWSKSRWMCSAARLLLVGEANISEASVSLEKVTGNGRRA